MAQIKYKALRVVVVSEVDDPVGLPALVPEVIPKPMQGLVALNYAARFQPE